MPNYIFWVILPVISVILRNIDIWHWQKTAKFIEPWINMHSLIKAIFNTRILTSLSKHKKNLDMIEFARACIMFLFDAWRVF